MQYASEGDLHKYLQKEFTEIDWKTKIIILEYISRGLFTIHDENFIHRDLHSGNILVDDRSYNFSEKPHPKAIYTSRPISSYISKCSSIFSKCSSINSSNDYTSIEVVLDIDIESKSKLLGTKRKIEELLNDNSYENNGKPKTLKLVPGFPH
ncbi:unnamed protein product [Rhizophagus irregularis]|uniref:Protein kinase domain-containing protein n=1 Tax=Rhizophagus irregularis TaxID=588596 RepID=A0A915ZHM0_9GLOM|nr:unnamed protein product [Rhizophagus irregularis]